MKKLIILFLTIMVLLCLNSVIAENGHSWYKTFKQVKLLYSKHYNRESRLNNYIYIENNKHVGTIIEYGKKVHFDIPNHFIHSMLNHLKTGLENDWFNYIFWADLNHGHLFISEELRGYYNNNSEGLEYFGEILKDNNLGILYHAAEHFCGLDPDNAKYIHNRNIVGWFNSKPTEIIFPKPDTFPGRLKANTAGVPDGYSNVWWIGVSASKNGVFSIEVNGEIIRLDISLDVEDIYDTTTPEERALTGE